MKSNTLEENRVFIDDGEILNPLEAEIERLRAELATEREARLRLAAEYANYRRRTKLESGKAAAEGKRELLMRLLSLADDFETAVEHLEETTGAVAEGLKLVHRRFGETLRANDVVPFTSEGEMFNPERHEAFDVAHGTKLKPGTVQAEIRRGYLWGDRLLRPALVVVAE